MYAVLLLLKYSKATKTAIVPWPSEIRVKVAVLHRRRTKTVAVLKAIANAVKHVDPYPKLASVKEFANVAASVLKRIKIVAVMLKEVKIVNAVMHVEITLRSVNAQEFVNVVVRVLKVISRKAPRTAAIMIQLQFVNVVKHVKMVLCLVNAVKNANAATIVSNQKRQRVRINEKKIVLAPPKVAHIVNAV